MNTKCKYSTEVHCKDCGTKWLKAKADVLRIGERAWSGRCQSCAMKLKLKLTQSGRVPNAVIFNSENVSGEKHWAWKGGITPMYRRLRSSAEHYEWRKKIFNRDKYTCQTCGSRGGYIHAHHILTFKHYPSFRLITSNGITLCKQCHKFIHKVA